MDALGGLFNFFTWGAFIPLIQLLVFLINKNYYFAGICGWISLILWLIWYYVTF